MKNAPAAPRSPAPDAAPPTSGVVRLFGRNRSLDGEREVPVGPTAGTARNVPAAAPALATPALDLSGRPKVLFAIGPGRSGKTMLLRYLLESATAAGRTAFAAALDPHNRSLATFAEGVEQPPAHDPAGVARWLEEFLGFLMEGRHSALLDMGGGDLSLMRLLDDVPDLAGSLDEAGIAPAALYTLSPQVDDLGVLAGLEAAGFQPKATALILNEGLADPTVPREDSFARVLRHSVFQAALARGAVPVWMPRLDSTVAAEIEGKRLRFAIARDGQAPDGQPGAVLGPFDRSRVRKWMAGMNMALDPIRSWLP